MFGNKYLLTGIATYLIACIVFVLKYSGDFIEIIFLIATIGFSFSTITVLLTKNLQLPKLKYAIKNEIWILAALLVWIVIYITFISSGITKLEQAHNVTPMLKAIITVLVKLTVFVGIPFAVYRIAGFKVKDFNIYSSYINKNIIILFFSLSAVIILFQYFLSNGSKPIRNGEFSTAQLSLGLPLCYIWLLIEAGIVEEFFFRAILQSRIAAITKSGTGAIIWGAIIFGLVHAPGLYLRGSASEGVAEQMPFLYWVCYTIIYMSVAGIFFGIIWHRTKKFWLLVALHAMFDLLPNLKEFLDTWSLDF